MARPKKNQNTNSNVLTAPAPETEKPDFTPVSQNPDTTNFVQTVPMEDQPLPSEPTPDKEIADALAGSQTTTSLYYIPTSFRDERGLIKNIEYIFTPEGLVDWKAMLFKKPEYLYILNDKKEEVEKKYGKSIFQLSPLEVDEKYLCITLQGIRYLANLRGYTRIKNNVDSVTYDPDYQVAVACTSTCEITWLPNFETDFYKIKSSDTAGANLRNCFGFTQKYVESMAANRAFVRAVRAFLNINIVAKDEVGPQEENPHDALVPVRNPNRNDDLTQAVQKTPHELLKENVEKLGISFTDFRTAVAKRYSDKVKSNAEEWKDYESIPRSDVFELIPIVKQRLKEKNTTK